MHIAISTNSNVLLSCDFSIIFNVSHNNIVCVCVCQERKEEEVKMKKKAGEEKKRKALENGAINNPEKGPAGKKKVLFAQDSLTLGDSDDDENNNNNDNPSKKRNLHCQQVKMV